MKIFFMTALLTVSSFAVAEPTVFGLEIGSTTSTQLQNKYNAKHTGINRYSEGSMYSIPSNQINFDGLQGVHTIFDSNDKLVAVMATLNKSKYDYINTAMRQKYNLIDEQKAFVGNQSATYLSDKTKIVLDAPHMSFTMSMNYYNKDFLNLVNKQIKLEAEAKEAQETSLL